MNFKALVLKIQIAFTKLFHSKLLNTKDKLFLRKDFKKISDTRIKDDLENLSLESNIKSYINEILIDNKILYEQKICKKNKFDIFEAKGNKYTPIYNKEGGMFDGFIGIKEIDNLSSFRATVQLYLVKKPHFSMEIFQEPYMISLQRILAGNNNSYKISFDKENIFVEYIPNLMQFSSVLDDKNFLKKKPKNLIMHYFISGILGSMDINPTNILINKRNKFYFVDNTIVYSGSKNKENIENNYTEKVFNLFRSYGEISVQSAKEKTEKIINQYLEIHIEYLNEMLFPIPKVSHNHTEFVRYILKMMWKIKDVIIPNFFNILSSEDIFYELLKIKSNINYKKIYKLKAKFENIISKENIILSDLGTSLDNYSESVIKNLKYFEANIK